ncbi:hypothetical protein L2E82_25652 [Cichorium intybus]|uniref:Uncharacterized protein n=1 Tax=Cichorium intybus TaxID=13427 RepID=A0ACB9E3N6_CICIN|nr:hypothetical protein L2E82_25652 [Cichorium intybus]
MSLISIARDSAKWEKLNPRFSREESLRKPSSPVPLKSGTKPPPLHDPLYLNVISNDGMLMILDPVSPSNAPSGSFFSFLVGTLVAALHTAASTKRNSACYNPVVLEPRPRFQFRF